MSEKISRRRFIELAAAAGGTLALGSLIGAETDEKQVEKKPKHERPLLFGVGMIWAFWLGRSKEYDLKQMDMLKQLGATVTSATFDWVDLEKEKGKWDWSYPDHSVEAAQKRGLKQIGYIGNTAKWALPEGVSGEHGYRHPPHDECEEDFANYCRKVAERYKGKVDMFQFWNEPNGCSWINDGCSNGHMYESYTRWLKVGYKALKEGNPDCTVGAAALDYHEKVHEGYRYLEGMYRSDAKDYFDVITIHPYGDPLHWQAVEDTRRVMVENGDADKPIWITEWGYNNSRGEEPAQKMREVLTALMKPEYSYVTVATYLCVTDLPIADTQQYGLCDRELNMRPIAHAFKELAKGKS